MDVSSSTGLGSIGVEVQKKAQDVQAQQVLKVLEGAEKTAQDTASQATTAQKTGLGNSLNIAG
jgi:hypothetical protein